MSDDALYLRCQRLAQKVLASQNWKLVKAGDPVFIEAVRQRLLTRFPDRLHSADSILDDAITRSVKAEYSVRLYEAFHQDGSPAQWLAMIEVKRIVFRYLLKMTEGNETASNDYAQQAISKAWEKLEKVKYPESFIYFVARLGIREKLTDDRKRKREVDLPEEVEPDKPVTPELIHPDLEVVLPPEIQSVRDRLVEVMKKCRLTAEETRVVIDFYLEGKTIAYLRITSGKTASALSSLKNRALKRLKGCKHFIDLRLDWLGGISK